VTHKYTLETIFHFGCGECKNWWSVALVHISGMSVYPEGKAYCPHCGKESITEKIEMKNS
jgi:predicted  nucleic acid-binding Zn ribbon protein